MRVCPFVRVSVCLCVCLSVCGSGDIWPAVAWRYNWPSVQHYSRHQQWWSFYTGRSYRRWDLLQTHWTELNMSVWFKQFMSVALHGLYEANEPAVQSHSRVHSIHSVRAFVWPVSQVSSYLLPSPICGQASHSSWNYWNLSLSVPKLADLFWKFGKFEIMTGVTFW